MLVTASGLRPSLALAVKPQTEARIRAGAGIPSGAHRLLARRAQPGRRATRRAARGADDDDDEDFDEEGDAEWLFDVEAGQVDPYDVERDDGDSQELGQLDDEDEDLVQYRNPEEQDPMAVEKLKPPQYDPDPRMRIMTKDGSRFDEDGTDRLKFAWEKVAYEVPEIHQTPEQLELRAEVEAEQRLIEGEMEERPHDIDKWMENVDDWSDLMGDKAWDILDQYFPAPEEEERELRRIQRLELLSSDDIEPEQRMELEAEQERYEEEEKFRRVQPDYQETVVDEETGEKWLSNNAILKRWRAARKYLRQSNPDYTEVMQVAGDDFVWQVNRVDPLVPIPLKTEEVLSKWETRAAYEVKKRKERNAAAYWKHFEERVGAEKEYQCTAENDVRLKPRDGSKLREWTDEEIMNLITMNGLNADPQDVIRDSLKVFDPKAPCDHVNDLGLKYVPSMEEAIEEAGLFMQIDNVDYSGDEPSLVNENFSTLDGISPANKKDSDSM